MCTGTTLDVHIKYLPTRWSGSCLVRHSNVNKKWLETVKIGSVQAERAAQELPGLVAPISRGLNAAVERLSVLEHSCLRHGDAVQAPDLETALARWDVTRCKQSLLQPAAVVYGMPYEAHSVGSHR